VTGERYAAEAEPKRPYFLREFVGQFHKRTEAFQEPLEAIETHFGDRRLSPRLSPPPEYTLTRICSVEYTKRMESVFEIIAEPNRRAILSLLVSSQQSVGEIERQLRMTQPTVSKHLRVLREAGFVESTVDAQRRLYRLKPEPLQEVDAWLAQFHRFWSAHVDALERHLDRMDQSAPTKRKTRMRTTRPKPRTRSRSRDHDRS
jgi:DNA-binding transcriptional ArsR family regulator